MLIIAPIAHHLIILSPINKFKLKQHLTNICESEENGFDLNFTLNSQLREGKLKESQLRGKEGRGSMGYQPKQIEIFYKMVEQRGI